MRNALLTGSSPAEAVAEPGRVAHQLAHRRRRLERRQHRFAVGTHHDLAVLVPCERLQAGELGCVLRNRIVELPLALLVELHHRDAGDRLRHRVDAEERIERHLLVRRLLADALEVGDLAVANQHVGHAGCVAVGDRLLHPGVECIEPHGGEAQCGRIADCCPRPGEIRAGGRLRGGADGDSQSRDGSEPNPRTKLGCPHDIFLPRGCCDVVIVHCHGVSSAGRKRCSKRR